MIPTTLLMCRMRHGRESPRRGFGVPPLRKRGEPPENVECNLGEGKRVKIEAMLETHEVSFQSPAIDADTFQDLLNLGQEALRREEGGLSKLLGTGSLKRNGCGGCATHQYGRPAVLIRCDQSVQDTRSSTLRKSGT